MEDPDNIEITAKKVDDSLKRLHKDEGYTIFMMKSIIEGIGKVLTMVKYALGGIGVGISIMIKGKKAAASHPGETRISSALVPGSP